MFPDDTTLKRCSKCGVSYPATAEYFHRSKAHKGGFVSRCKLCIVAYRREYNAENSEMRAEYTRQYAKEHSEWKTAYDHQYYKDNNDNVRARTREYKRSHAEYEREYQRQYRKTEHGKATHRACRMRRRARIRLATGSFGAKDVKALRRGQTDKNGNLRCWWCGKVISEYHIDHRVPLAKGGGNHPNNLCLSCPSCNSSKKARLPHEWNGRLL